MAATAQQRKDRWKHADIVFTLTFYKSMIRHIRQAIRYMEQLVVAYNAHASIMGWSSRLTLVLSIEDGHVHIHALLESTPGWTAFHWIREYWHMRYGQVHPDKDELRNPTGYAIYCDRQTIKTIVDTCNWPQSSPQNQNPNLTGKCSNDPYVHTIHCPFGNSVSGTNSNSSINQPSVHGCPEPVHDPELCRPYDEPPELEEAEVARIHEESESPHCDNNYSFSDTGIVDRVCESSHCEGDSDNGQLVEQPATGMPQARATLVHFGDAVNCEGVNLLLPACESCNSEGRRGGPGNLDAGNESPKGGVCHVRDNPAVIGYGAGCPGIQGHLATVREIKPVITPARAGPPRAAPDSMPPAA